MITELVWCLLRSRFKCRHTTLLCEERWVRDAPKSGCKGDYHCQGNGQLFRFISILGILTPSSLEIKKPKSVLKLRRWISIKNYNSVFFWISFFFCIIRKLEKRICIALIFFFLLIKPARAGRLFTTTLGFPPRLHPQQPHTPPPPPPPKKKTKERKKGRKEGKFKDRYLGVEVRYWISCVLLQSKIRISKSKSRFPSRKYP